MTRLPALRRQTLALLVALIAVGSTSAHARPQDGTDDGDDRHQRQEQRKQRAQPEPEQAQPEPAQSPQPQQDHPVQPVQERAPQREHQRAPQRHERRGDASGPDFGQRHQERTAEDGNTGTEPDRVSLEQFERQRQGRDADRRSAERPQDADQHEANQRQREARQEERRAQAGRDQGGARDGDWRDRDERNDRLDRNERHDPDGRNDRLSRDEQRRLIEQQRSSAIAWQRAENGRRSHLEQRARDLERQRRMAQYRYQQDYHRRWLAQQSRWNASRHDYDHDPFYYTVSNYRYGYGGNWYNTNRYGANVLQQAIRDGYQEGWRAGRADRMDGWRFDYRNSFAYEDGSYGYDGYYVNQHAYRHYFRQGFQRGYDDAYYSRNQYGRYDNRNGLAVILPVILAAILGIQRY